MPTATVDSTSTHRRGDQTANDWLNGLVERKIVEARSRDLPMSPELAWAADTGHAIYRRRLKILVFAILAGCAYGVAQASHWPSVLFAIVLLYFYLDFYSGVLHVVLDHPSFIRLPLIGVPCAEFQWHHNLPFDISTRSILDVWGDLNVVILLNVACLFAIAGFNETSMMVAGLGFSLAYVNQWSHRLAHTSPRKRPRIANWLHRWRILLEPAVHHVHHSTYDDAFPVLNGHSRGLIQLLLRIAPDRRLWLGVFCALTVLDLAAVAWLVDALRAIE